jgi:tRNA-(ms[2]io[6]A)-hydroxylase
MGAEPDNKRRLPVLRESEVSPEDEERPPWHWSGIGAIGVFVFWLPLTFAANALAKAGTLWAVLNASAFVLAAFGSGFLVGRFGGKAGKREATVGGGAAGALAWLLAVTQGTSAGLVPWALTLLAMVGLGAGAARAGGAVGVARRGRTTRKAP